VADWTVLGLVIIIAYLWWGEKETSEHQRSAGQNVIQNDLSYGLRHLYDNELDLRPLWQWSYLSFCLQQKIVNIKQKQVITLKTDNLI